MVKISRSFLLLVDVDVDVDVEVDVDVPAVLQCPVLRIRAKIVIVFPNPGSSHSKPPKTDFRTPESFPMSKLAGSEQLFAAE